MSALDFELGQAQERLKVARRRAKEYLSLKSNKTQLEDKEQFDWFGKLEKAINQIMRRESICFNFGPKGCASWYAETFKLFAEWLDAENELCKIISRQAEGMNFGK